MLNQNFYFTYSNKLSNALAMLFIKFGFKFGIVKSSYTNFTNVI